MRTIGMLGGMSWESSAEYYRIANELVAARLGGYHSAKVILASVDFAEIERLQAAGDWEEAGRLLAARARGLEAAGAELLVLCTNTMHLVSDQVEAACSIPFLHIADAAAAAIKSEQVGKVGLLGTSFTMEQGFYADRLRSHGLQVLIPEADDRLRIHEAIYGELVHGIIREESREDYLAVIDRLVADGAGGIVLGCTEIELLIRPGDARVPVFATTRLHVEAAVELALAP